MARPRFTNKIVLFLFASAVALLAAYLFWSVAGDVKALLEHRMGVGANPSASADTIVNVIKLLLVGIVGYFFVRALNSIFFGLTFWLKQIDAPTLIRNIFTIVAFTIVFLIAFTFIFPDVNLGALFTTSAIFGVILGLALQDTLGNFFAGISLQADRPFQVGDVIIVGAQRHTGVVEEISWRAIKIRTFANHVVLIANSNAAKEPIEVCPRDNLNARVVFFRTLYTDSPAKTIHVVREAVRETDNVSEKITPIVRIRNL
ncbi:MAG TPA: mechanosensitive ion channel domain-containing protein, partial [Pyrinomonadaceae bacterium]